MIETIGVFGPILLRDAESFEAFITNHKGFVSEEANIEAFFRRAEVQLQTDHRCMRGSQ
jgi:hypothetical protein